MEDQNINDLIERELEEVVLEEILDLDDVEGHGGLCSAYSRYCQSDEDEDIVSLKIDLLEKILLSNPLAEDSMSNAIDMNSNNDWFTLLSSIDSPFCHEIESDRTNPVDSDDISIASVHTKSIPDRFSLSTLLNEYPEFKVILDIMENLISCIEDHPSLIDVGHPIRTVSAVSVDDSPIILPRVLTYDTDDEGLNDGYCNSDMLRQFNETSMDFRGFIYLSADSLTGCHCSDSFMADVSDCHKEVPTIAIESPAMSTVESLLVPYDHVSTVTQAVAVDTVKAKSMQRIEVLNAEINRLKTSERAVMSS